jgi:hypothetical protein
MNTLSAQTAYVGSTEIKQVRLGSELVLAPNGNELWYKSNELPSLDLRFAEDKSLVDATTGSNLVDFTRASSGTYVGSDGLIKTATTNEPRFDHDPTTGESLGLLVEESRTNLLLSSEEFNTTWTLSDIRAFGSGSVVDATVAPNGQTTADLLTENNQNAVHKANQAVSVTSGLTYTFSCFIKRAGGSRNAVLTLRTAAFGASYGVSLDLSTGVTSERGGATIFDSKSYGNGWWRVWLTATATSTVSSFVDIGLLDDTTVSYQGDDASGIYIWGAQLEEGSFPTSYIPTEGSIVTRVVDVASISGSNFSSWYRQDEGTIFNNSTVIAPNVQTQAAWSLTGGTYNTSLRQPQSTGDRFRAQIGDTFTLSPGTGNPLSSGTRKACVAYSGTAGRLQVGSSSDDATAVGVLDPTQFNIGSLDSTGAILNGTIRRLTYWPTRLPNDTLETITQ